jgi:hypothetical protein
MASSILLGKVIVTSNLCLMDILTLGCTNRIAFGMVITDQMKFTDSNTQEENRAGILKKLFKHWL